MAGLARRALKSPQAQASSSGRIRIPNTITDPVWSLRPWPLVVSIAGDTVELPALSAADWLSALMSDEMSFGDLFLGLADDLEAAIDEALLHDAVTPDELQDLFLDIISSVAGRPWYIALRIIGSVKESWHVLGPELLKWVQVTEVSLSAWLDVALVVILRQMEEKDVPLFVARLEAPPEGQEPEEMTMSSQDFAALMAGQ